MPRVRKRRKVRGQIDGSDVLRREMRTHHQAEVCRVFGFHHEERRMYTPAEVQEGSGRLWNALVHPGQEVKLRHSPSLVGLNVFQVETANQEVLTPNVL